MAPTIAGTNCITRTEDAIVSLLSNLTSFQTLVNVPDPVSAAQRIYLHDVPQTDEEDSDTWSDNEWFSMFPCCVVREPEEGTLFELFQTARDLAPRYLWNFHYSVCFEAYVTTGLNVQDQIRHFLNLTGGIVEEIYQRSEFVSGEFEPTTVRYGTIYRRAYAKRESLGDVMGFAIGIERRIE